MFGVHNDLAVPHQHPLAAVPVPLSPATARSLRKSAARDHVHAEATRKSGQVQRSRGYRPRTDRLARTALRAEARAIDLTAEAR